MRTLFIGLTCCFASLVNAEALTCEDNYPLFEKIIFEKMSIKQKGNEQEIHDYSNKYEYSYLFNDKHLDQRYWTTNLEWFNSEWISLKEYNKRIKKIAKDHEKIDFLDFSYDLLPNKANITSKVGEICVVPVQKYFNLEGDNGKEFWIEGMLIDHLFVRDLKNNEWRVLEYNSYINNQDFNEFFPDLPYEIKNELNDGTVEAQDATSSDED